MDSQRSNLPPNDPLRVTAATLLLLTGTTVCSNETPPWGRERALELIDTLLTLATEHGFAQKDALREKLITGVHTARTRLLAEVAFSAVPAAALLDAIRRSDLYTGE